jgi:hypothetical protein
MSDRIADALALYYSLNQLSLFIMMTTNSKWPEIISQLKAGQTALDTLVIICRAFQNCLAALCKFLHSYFGHILYRITVIEFRSHLSCLELGNDLWPL